MDDMKYCPRCGNVLEDKQIDGKERRVCSDESCGYVFWNNPVPVVTAVIEYDGSVVLARNSTWPPKVFGLITGFLESGETPEEAVVREVSEELGLAGVIKDFLGLFPFYQMNQLLIAYTVEAEGTIELGDELEEYRLIKPEKVRPWEFGTGHIVKEWVARNVKTE